MVLLSFKDKFALAHLFTIGMEVLSILRLEHPTDKSVHMVHIQEALLL